MRSALHLMLLVTGALAAPQEPKVRMTFSPESERFFGAACEYENIWRTEGQRILDAMERVSGLQFFEKEIQAIVYEGVSYSGFGGRPMKLRGSYPMDVKKATRIHELGHRLTARIPKSNEIDEHRVLFLILYDIWTRLYGKDFADKSVEVETERRGLYDYQSAWEWALSFSATERAARFKRLAHSIENRRNPCLDERSLSCTIGDFEPQRLFDFTQRNCTAPQDARAEPRQIEECRWDPTR